jgi:copper chaperone
MTELKVSNMTCSHCVGAVTHAVKSIDPQADVQVDLEAGRVRIVGAASAEDLVKVLDEAGYPATK